ncbi:hypothetical protein [Paraburkholderia hayleyella]|uniref:hypothetical protein n=1 Tax=Paraburkholderia hayleyella TaxID=2152889 RepID=UPI0012909C44|nr:hypothetical protein [Paraburkholderia hayleyella]
MFKLFCFPTHKNNFIDLEINQQENPATEKTSLTQYHSSFIKKATLAEAYRSRAFLHTMMTFTSTFFLVLTIISLESPEKIMESTEDEHAFSDTSSSEIKTHSSNQFFLDFIRALSPLVALTLISALIFSLRKAQNEAYLEHVPPKAAMTSHKTRST